MIFETLAREVLRGFNRGYLGEENLEKINFLQEAVIV